jgi:hypothetical protein
MPIYKQLVTRTRKIPALGHVQEQEITFDVLEGCRFQGIAKDFKADSGEPSSHVFVDMLDGDKPLSVIFYGEEACKKVKNLVDDELISIAGQEEQTKTLRAWELYLGDRDPMKDKLLWAHPEILESIPGRK